MSNQPPPPMYINEAFEYPDAPQGAYPPPGGAPYPPPKGAAYPPPRGAAYPPQGVAAYPPPGGAAYPPQGVAAYPPQGVAAYPPRGGAAYPPQTGAAYPPRGGAAYPPQTGAAYPPRGGAAYPPPGVYPAGGYPPQQGAYGSGPGVGSAPPMVPCRDEEHADSQTSNDDFAGDSFSDKAVRRRFIKKVYLILFTQLLTTVGIICFFMFFNPAKRWVRANIMFYYVSYGVFVVTYIALVCCPTVRRKYPGNYIALGIFTLAFSYMCGTITSFHDIPTVLIAAGITCAVCLAISIFAIQTKCDFTMCNGIIFALSMVFIFFDFAVLIIYVTVGFSYILHCVYGALAALIFSVFLAYDTQILMGKHKYKLSAEEHIYAACQLYLDVVMLFLMIILSFFGGSSN